MSEDTGEPANGDISNEGSKSETAEDKTRPCKQDIGPADTENKGWHSEEREHHRIERFYWRVTGCLTFVAVVGAIATVLISVSTYKEAVKATAEAHRQAEIAAAGLSRSWLYIELPTRMDVTTNTPFTGSMTFTQSIAFRNYGDLPAIITFSKAVLLVKQPNPGADFPFDEQGSLNPYFERVTTIFDKFEGTIVPKNEVSTVQVPLAFAYRSQSAYAMAGPKWLLVQIRYNDPHGENRETCYLSDVRFGQGKALPTKYCNYQR